MSGPKTVKTEASVGDFLAAVPDPRRRADAQAVCALMAEVTGLPPAMWGSGIVGFGSYHYRYATGREGEWPAVALSPRKTATTLYLAGLEEADLSRLGPHSVGKSCLYVKRLSEIDTEVLKELVKAGFNGVNGKLLTS
jgi:hypothetical protein